MFRADQMPRALREATTAECRNAMRRADFIAEWRRMAFYRHDATLTIVRAGFDGIHGGWRYISKAMMRLDWQEICFVAESLEGPGSHYSTHPERQETQHAYN
jgi:hypothetical protein